VESLISDEMQRSIGRELGRRRSFPIDSSDIRRWAVAVYYPAAPPPIYWDETHESTVRNGGIVAPDEFNPFAWMTASGPRPQTGEEGWGPENTLGIAAPETSFMLNGGVSSTYTGVPMRPGDVIESVSRLKDYRERPGRLGQMLFTVTEDVWTNQRGDGVRTSETIIIRY
jgi:N-terminal half of MaoC dehydratase